jgi:hypothetical protein
MPDSPTLRHFKKGYILHVHTAGGRRDTPCTFILLAVEGTHLARSYCWRWKGIHPARPYCWRGKAYTLHTARPKCCLWKWIHPALAYCWRWKGRHPAHPYCWLWKEIHPARPFWWLWKWIHSVRQFYCMAVEKGYTKHVRRSYCWPRKWIHPARPYSWRWKEIHSAAHTADVGGGERDAHCQVDVQLHVVERDTPCTSISSCLWCYFSYMILKN